MGGLTGEQLSLLRLWEDEQRCAFVFFDRDPKGPEERCIEDTRPPSRFCDDHMPEQDAYDCYIDRGFE